VSLLRRVATWTGLGVVLLGVLTGCTARETVMMRNPRTHQIARCAEGYRRFINGGGYQRQEDCVAEYERKGYERISGGDGEK
jgi:hypothetical protein